MTSWELDTLSHRFANIMFTSSAMSENTSLGNEESGSARTRQMCVENGHSRSSPQSTNGT